MKPKNWNIAVLGACASILLLSVTANGIIDPFLHYHKPLTHLEYPLKDSRYQNDGIARHFEYDAIITGTSMAQNFKASEVDALWGAKTIKMTFSGATYREVDENVRRALSYNRQVKYVIRSLDGNCLNMPADSYAYDGYPTYLYDNNPFNDVNYLMNKETLTKSLAVINYTRAGNKTPDMDEYDSWIDGKVFGREAVLRGNPDLGGEWDEYQLSEEECRNIKENIERNVIQTALDNPQVTFYFFIPPYSISYWRACFQTKQLNSQLEAEQMAVEMMVGIDNIHVFSFWDNMEMIGNFDNYTDSLHYGDWVNSDILKWMYNGEYELTEENYVEYYDEIRKLYSEYDYDGI